MIKPIPLVAEVLRKAILVDGETISDAARKTGVTKTTTSRVFSGKSALSPFMVVKLENAYGLNLKHLLLAQIEQAYEEEKRRQT